MSEARNQRFEIDIDEIERQLRRSVEQPAEQKPDPLAELARIVGQNDPFQGILSNAQTARPAARVDAANANQQHAAAPAPAADHAYAPSGLGFPDQISRPSAAEPAPQPAHRDEYAQPAHRDPYEYAQPAPAQTYPDTPEDDRYDPVSEVYGSRDDSFGHEEVQPLRKRPSRGRLVAVAAALVVTVGAVAAGMSYRKSGGFLASGTPPVITADKSPLKVAPENPGGVEVPNQDRQIYAKAGQDGQSRVVDGREQPVDVRSVTPPVPAPTERSAVSDALGEPRRVRTVAVNPDGTSYGRAATPAAATQNVIPTESLPAPVSVQTVAVPSHGGAPAAAPADRVPAAAPAPVAAEMPSTHQAVNVLPPVRPRIGGEGPTRTASVAPAETAPKPAPTEKPKPADAAKPAAADKPAEKPAATAGGKNFTVQIAVRPTEQEARTAWDQAQEKFGASLENKPARLTSAQVAGKTVHRVRLGPMTKPEADAMCGKLKAKGGACFVANN